MTLKFVLAPDSFKESATAKEICEAMETGIRRVFPKSQVVHVPMADGGEGSTEAIVDATKGQYIKKVVQGPLGNKVEATIGIHGDEETAVIEMATASGIHLVPKDKRNPYYTSTYGTGELMSYCLDKGIRRIILCLGGSATNDGGVGMAQALGYQFKDKEGKKVKKGGIYLKDIVSIDSSKAHKEIPSTEILIASDVNNPLTGPEGASAVFGPQKGASPEMVAELDQALANLDEIIKRDLGKSVGEIPGAGAAGGLGAGLLAFTGATLERGVEVLVEATNLKEKLKDADICFTGEGQIDFQTKYGKTPYGVLEAAKEVEKDINVIAICGSIGSGIEELYNLGFNAILGTIPSLTDPDTIIENTTNNVTRVSEAVCRILK
jgi:glycerate kinase